MTNPEESKTFDQEHAEGGPKSTLRIEHDLSGDGNLEHGGRDRENLEAVDEESIDPER